MLFRLVQRFASRVTLPIEVDEVIEALTSFGWQDEIRIQPVDTDPGILRGTCVQWHESPAPYAQPSLVTLITYSSKMDLEHQRLVCVKELVHACDPPALRVRNSDRLRNVLEKLVLPLQADQGSLENLINIQERIAIYQALAILFPLPAREAALDGLTTGKYSFEEIVRWACLPNSYVGVVLHDRWPEFVRDMFHSVPE